MITISASKIKTFTECSRKYYYHYIDRIPEPVGGRALLGRCVHKAIELGFQGQDALSVYNEYWLRGASEVQDNSNLTKLYNEGLQMVDKYNFHQAPPIEMELGFNLPFPNEKEPLCYVQGYIDQIFQHGVIVDLKTGLRRPKAGVLDNMPQFVLYGWAYSQLYGELPRHIYWEHLRTAERIEAHISLEAVEDVYDNAEELIERLQQTQDARKYTKNVGSSCDYCAYRGPCLGKET